MSPDPSCATKPTAAQINTRPFPSDSSSSSSSASSSDSTTTDASLSPDNSTHHSPASPTVLINPTTTTSPPPPPLHALHHLKHPIDSSTNSSLIDVSVALDLLPRSIRNTAISNNPGTGSVTPNSISALSSRRPSYTAEFSSRPRLLSSDPESPETMTNPSSPPMLGNSSATPSFAGHHHHTGSFPHDFSLTSSHALATTNLNATSSSSSSNMTPQAPASAVSGPAAANWFGAGRRASAFALGQYPPRSAGAGDSGAFTLDSTMSPGSSAGSIWSSGSTAGGFNGAITSAPAITVPSATSNTNGSSSNGSYAQQSPVLVSPPLAPVRKASVQSLHQSSFVLSPMYVSGTPGTAPPSTQTAAPQSPPANASSPSMRFSSGSSIDTASDFPDTPTTPLSMNQNPIGSQRNFRSISFSHADRRVLPSRSPPKQFLPPFYEAQPASPSQTFQLTSSPPLQHQNNAGGASGGTGMSPQTQNSQQQQQQHQAHQHSALSQYQVVDVGDPAVADMLSKMSLEDRRMLHSQAFASQQVHNFLQQHQTSSPQFSTAIIPPANIWDSASRRHSLATPMDPQLRYQSHFANSSSPVASPSTMFGTFRMQQQQRPQEQDAPEQSPQPRRSRSGNLPFAAQTNSSPDSTSPPRNGHFTQPSSSVPPIDPSIDSYFSNDFLGRNTGLDWNDLNGATAAAMSGTEGLTLSAMSSLISVPSRKLYFVQFKSGRVDVFYIPESNNLEVHVNDLVIVDADRGRDLGKVIKDHVRVEEAGWLKWRQHQEQQAALQQAPSSPGGSASNNDGPTINAPSVVTPKQIIRYAQYNEVQQVGAKQVDEDKAVKMCSSKVQEKGLLMSVLDAEYQWDRRKLTFFYSASHRIDFRELVRDLFRIYKTRIWMCAVHTPNGEPVVAPEASGHHGVPINTGGLATESNRSVAAHQSQPPPQQATSRGHEHSSSASSIGPDDQNHRPLGVQFVMPNGMVGPGGQMPQPQRTSPINAQFTPWKGSAGQSSPQGAPQPSSSSSPQQNQYWGGAMNPAGLGYGHDGVGGPSATFNASPAPNGAYGMVAPRSADMSVQQPPQHYGPQMYAPPPPFQQQQQYEVAYGAAPMFVRNGNSSAGSVASAGSAGNSSNGSDEMRRQQQQQQQYSSFTTRFY